MMMMEGRVTIIRSTKIKNKMLKGLLGDNFVVDNKKKKTG